MWGSRGMMRSTRRREAIRTVEVNRLEHKGESVELGTIANPVKLIAALKRRSLAVENY